jgi:hypothetical protein
MSECGMKTQGKREARRGIIKNYPRNCHFDADRRFYFIEMFMFWYISGEPNVGYTDFPFVEE